MTVRSSPPAKPPSGRGRPAKTARSGKLTIRNPKLAIGDPKVEQTTHFPTRTCSELTEQKFGARQETKSWQAANLTSPKVGKRRIFSGGRRVLVSSREGTREGMIATPPPSRATRARPSGAPSLKPGGRRRGQARSLETAANDDDRVRPPLAAIRGPTSEVKASGHYRPKSCLHRPKGQFFIAFRSPLGHSDVRQPVPDRQGDDRDQLEWSSLLRASSGEDSCNRRERGSPKEQKEDGPL